MTKIYKATCNQCGRDYEPLVNYSKYCSNNCGRAYRRAHKPKITRWKLQRSRGNATCLNCEARFNSMAINNRICRECKKSEEWRKIVYFSREHGDNVSRIEKMEADTL